MQTWTQIELWLLPAFSDFMYKICEWLLCFIGILVRKAVSSYCFPYLRYFYVFIHILFIYFFSFITLVRYNGIKYY